MQARKALLEVLSGRVPWRRPAWFMRQAGRYLPEYRDIRRQAGSFLGLCGAPELASEVTLQPLRRYDLDAAIIFADILLVPWAMGADLDFRENEGPVLSRTTSERDLRALGSKGFRGDRLEPVYAALRLVKAELPDHVALIGFCGAPWTVASYMVEGGSSEERLNARAAAYGQEPWFEALIERLVEVSSDYLVRQVEAGADVLQVFDSWAGDLDDGLQERYCIRPIRMILERLKAAGCDVPVIGFARGIGAGHVRFLAETGVSAVGVESSVPVVWMARALAGAAPVQGNLDPVALAIGGRPLALSVESLVKGLRADRHIFNLGHGIRPSTPPEHLSEALRLIRDFDSQG